MFMANLRPSKLRSSEVISGMQYLGSSAIAHQILCSVFAAKEDAM